jgi:hypothetical protein
MGLIKSIFGAIFGAIFGLLGGIFKAIGGLVGLGKKSEFFLEADDDDSDSLPATPAAPKAQPAAAQAEPVAAAPAQASAKTSTKAPAKAKASEKAPAAPAEPVPTAFASIYLTSVGTTMPRRRRPGPSLSPFLEMAKQVKAR